MPEPWNSIIALVVGVPLCLAALLEVLGIVAAVAVAPNIEAMRRSLDDL